jgi:delta-aminolevulinic acid dehydratase/porphobilinogen synthase
MEFCKIDSWVLLPNGADECLGAYTSESPCGPIDLTHGAADRQLANSRRTAKKPASGVDLVEPHGQRDVDVDVGGTGADFMKPFQP